MLKSVELRAKRAGIVEQMRAVVALAETEKRSMTGEESAKWDAMNADVDKLKGEIDAIEGEEKRSAERVTKQAELDTEIRSARKLPDVGETRQENDEADEKRAEAWDIYIRRGFAAVPDELRSSLEFAQLSSDEQRTTSAGFNLTAATGGYLAPTQFNQGFMQVLKSFVGVRNAPVSVLTTTFGNDLPMPTFDDTSNTGELLAEETATAQDAIPATGRVVLKSFMFSSKIIPVSVQLIQDSSIDINSLLNAACAERIGRSQATYMTTGTGTGQPQGIVTGAADSSATLSLTSLASGTAGVPAIAIQDVLDNIVHSVDLAYRNDPSSGYMFNDSLLKIFKKAKDTTGRKIWQAGLAEGEPDTINGRRYYLNQQMAVGDTAAQKAILFGAFKYFQIRDVNGVVLIRLTERLAEFFQVGYLAFQRADSRMTNSAAIKYAAIAA